jgi:drug/metabolite transporter (DMT)-like permease
VNTAWKFVLIFAALITFVTGQLIFKRAMETSHAAGFGKQFAKWFIPGICSMTVSFFLTLGLLQHLDLSYVYPFQGLSVIIISVTAAVLLKEKLTLQLAIGALLISLGVVLVSLS